MRIAVVANGYGRSVTSMLRIANSRKDTYIKVARPNEAIMYNGDIYTVFSSIEHTRGMDIDQLILVDGAEFSQRDLADTIIQRMGRSKLPKEKQIIVGTLERLVLNG